MQFQNLSIIIPVYNEEATLLNVLKKLAFLKDKCNLEIIIINDGSIDNSKQIIESSSNLYTKAIHLKKNSGKGKAVIEGIKNCLQLAKKNKVSKSEVMIIYNKKLSVCPITTHIKLKNISKNLTQKKF